MDIIHVPELRNLSEKMTKILPKLISLMSSDNLRKHEIWGQMIPFSVPSYGTGMSFGHCVRPDIIITEDGPIICELDFVPSGRGYLLSSLPIDMQRQWLENFANWYANMGVEEILYATASVTICDQETNLFVDLLKEYHDINIKSINIDEYDKSKINGALIDRLFYAAEMKTPDNLLGCNVSTAEPHFDSKMIFAVIHDLEMNDELLKIFGSDDLAFLRKVFPYSRPVSLLSEKDLDFILSEKDNWVIKSCEVEDHNSWGCRGTFMGASYTTSKFKDILLGEREIKNKSIGLIPIIQRYHQSKDFRPFWNGMVDGLYRKPTLSLFDLDEKTTRHADKMVGGRFGLYFLVDRLRNICNVPDFGIVTLRSDRLVHGAKDAFVTSCSF